MLPLVRIHRRATTASNRIRCAVTVSATVRICTHRKPTVTRTSRRSSWGCSQTIQAWWRPVWLYRRNTCGPDGPSWACSSPRRYYSCNRTPWSGDGSVVSVFLTYCKQHIVILTEQKLILTFFLYYHYIISIISIRT